MSVPALVHPGLTVDDEEDRLALALRHGKAWALRELLVDYRAYVARILCRILGPRADLDDLIHDVFVRALECVSKLREGDALKPWLGSIAVFVAREDIRRRKRRKWLFFLPPEELPELASLGASVDVAVALRAAYAVIGKLGADEQIVFALRYLDGRTLDDIAGLVGCSLATVKRRLSRAEGSFAEKAAADAWLSSWIKGGT